MWFIGLGLIWLYFWLTCFWFARVIGFLVVSFGVLALETIGAPPGGDPTTRWLIIIFGWVAAWLSSGLPIYVRRLMATAEGSKACLDVPFLTPDSGVSSEHGWKAYCSTESFPNEPRHSRIQETR